MNEREANQIIQSQQAARKAEIAEANQLRTTAGATPTPNLDSSDLVLVRDSQTGAEVWVPLYRLGFTPIDGPIGSIGFPVEPDHVWKAIDYVGGGLWSDTGTGPAIDLTFIEGGSGPNHGTMETFAGRFVSSFTGAMSDGSVVIPFGAGDWTVMWVGGDATGDGGTMFNMCGFDTQKGVLADYNPIELGMGDGVGFEYRLTSGIADVPASEIMMYSFERVGASCNLFTAEFDGSGSFINAVWYPDADPVMLGDLSMAPGDTVTIGGGVNYTHGVAVWLGLALSGEAASIDNSLLAARALMVQT